MKRIATEKDLGGESSMCSQAWGRGEVKRGRAGTLRSQRKGVGLSGPDVSCQGSDLSGFLGLKIFFF